MTVPVDTSQDPDIIPPQPAEDRRVVGDLIEATEHEEPTVTELTPQERADFATLMTVGRRSKKLDIMGHNVVIQTLKGADELRIGLYTKQYLDTQGFGRAYQIAVVASAIREVNGAPLFRSLSEKTTEDEIFDKSVEAVSEYYPVVITQIYQAVMDLEKEFADLAIKLGKLKG